MKSVFCVHRNKHDYVQHGEAYMIYCIYDEPTATP
jgi:hypothetical protein